MITRLKITPAPAQMVQKPTMAHVSCSKLLQTTSSKNTSSYLFTTHENVLKCSIHSFLICRPQRSLWPLFFLYDPITSVRWHSATHPQLSQWITRWPVGVALRAARCSRCLSLRHLHVLPTYTFPQDNNIWQIIFFLEVTKRVIWFLLHIFVWFSPFLLEWIEFEAYHFVANPM